MISEYVSFHEWRLSCGVDKITYSKIIIIKEISNTIEEEPVMHLTITYHSGMLIYHAHRLLT